MDETGKSTHFVLKQKDYLHISKKNAIFAAKIGFIVTSIDKITLYRMTHIENIPHILQYGVVHGSSPNSNSSYVSIGDTSLIDYRSNKSVSTIDNERIILGEFIPFYFGVRMPMLYVIQHGGNFVPRAQHADEIIYVGVSLLAILNGNFDFYFSNGHATDSLTTFYNKQHIEQLPSIIDWEAVKTHQWAGDGIGTDVKRRKQAEFLIKQDIPFSLIRGFVCYSEKSKAKLMSQGVREDLIKVFPCAYY